MRTNVVSDGLEPHRLGTITNGSAGISPYGVLMRMCRMGHLPPSRLASSLGVAIKRGDHLLARPHQSVPIFRQLAALAPVVDTRYWDPEVFWPFSGAKAAEFALQVLRECPDCTRSGYHSLLFQMPGVIRCPWHRTPLIDRCKSCDRFLSAGWAHGCPPGQCPCGAERFSVGAAALAGIEGPVRIDELEAHIAAAQHARLRHWLLAPEGNRAGGYAALHALAPRSPARRQVRTVVDPDTELHLETVRLHPRPTPAAVSRGLYQSIEHITTRLEAELELQVPRLDEPPHKPGRGRAAGMKPVHPAFQAGALDRDVRRSAERLKTALNPFSSLFEPAGLAEAFTSEASSSVGWRLLYRLLTRGFAEGSRFSLTKPSGRPEETVPSRPRVPWALIDLSDDARPSARIVWTRRAAAGTLNRS